MSSAECEAEQAAQEPPQQQLEEEAALAAELHEQLQEQIAALAEVEHALEDAAAGDSDLLAVKLQLEEGIVHLRDTLAALQAQQLQQQEQQQQQQQQQQQEQLLPDEQRPAWLAPGASCLFRHCSGLWHCGVVQEVQQTQLQVRFAFPTRSFMLQPVVVPLALVQPTADPTAPHNSSSEAIAVGSRLLALPPGSGQLWQAAEATAVLRGRAAGSSSSSSFTVWLVQQRRSVTLPALRVVCAQLAAPVASPDGPGAARSDEGSDEGADSDDSGGSGSEGSDSSGSDSDGEEGGAHLGLGAAVPDVLDHARLAAQAGVQQETATFADFERHSRGIASKLLARMGYRSGAGLGKHGSGMRAPLDVFIYGRHGLGHGAHHRGMKRAAGTAHGSRTAATASGRTRKRRRAAAARHAQQQPERSRQAKLEAATGEVGLFAFINSSLGSASEAAENLRQAGLTSDQPQPQTGGAAALAAAACAAAGASGPGSGGRAGRKAAQQQPDRRRLLGSQDALAAAKTRVTQLTAMLARNKSNGSLAPQIQAKLAAARQQLAAAERSHDALHAAVAGREATAKWLKF